MVFLVQLRRSPHDVLRLLNSLALRSGLLVRVSCWRDPNTQQSPRIAPPANAVAQAGTDEFRTGFSGRSLSNRRTLPGSGKTHLLCAIAQELIARGRRMYFTTAALLIQVCWSPNEI